MGQSELAPLPKRCEAACVVVPIAAPTTVQEDTWAMFERCGFDFVRPKGLKNTVMRGTVTPK